MAQPPYSRSQDNPKESTSSHQSIKLDHSFNELARCCICFENFTPNFRAPIAIPCGHSFCRLCVKKLCYGQIVACSICRETSVFGPKQMGKNIALISILEKLNLLDPDEQQVNHRDYFAETPRQPNGIPENILENIERSDFLSFSKHYFDLIKSMYMFEQETLYTALAMEILVDGHHNIEPLTMSMVNQHAQAISDINDSLDLAFQSMKKEQNLAGSYALNDYGRDPSLNESFADHYNPVDALRDPYEIATVRIVQISGALLGESQSMIHENNAPEDNPRPRARSEHTPPSGRDHSELAPPPPGRSRNRNVDTFVPASWDPVSRLFDMIPT